MRNFLLLVMTKLSDQQGARVAQLLQLVPVVSAHLAGVSRASHLHYVQSIQGL